MNEEKTQIADGVASVLNAELDTSHDCELCGSNCNERDELIKCEREINQLRVQNTDFILALIKCKNKFDFFRLLHIKERDTEKAKAHAEMVKMLSDVLGYGTPQVINEWQAIDTLSQQNWLNDGNVYEETEVINAELGLKKVYEVIDTSTDEYYQILGLFLSFDEAKSKITELDVSHDAISFHAEDADYEKIEIVERFLGWGERKKTVFTIERERVVNNEIDEFVWVVKT